jgi:hypothetical protein
METHPVMKYIVTVDDDELFQDCEFPNVLYREIMCTIKYTGIYHYSQSRTSGDQSRFNDPIFNFSDETFETIDGVLSRMLLTLKAARPDYIDNEDPLELTYWVENPITNERIFGTEPFGNGDTVTEEGLKE